jgi:hypothetical protein
MKSTNTFGVHFIVRQLPSGNCYIYARIAVNKSRSELALKQSISKDDWNTAKGIAKPKNEKLKQINSHLEEVRGKLVRHYQQLRLGDDLITAEAVKNAFLGDGKEQEQHSLLWLVSLHNTMMPKVLKYGSMKNYYTTERYIKAFLEKRYPQGDILLKHLNYEFITALDFFIRSQPSKAHDRCNNNGAMKHLQRFKKMIGWATENGWMDKNPFAAFKLKFKRKERDYLRKEELESIERKDFDKPMLLQIKELFIFSCYTGLAYCDLIQLKPENVVTGQDGLKWLSTCRVKTDTPVHVPLLKQALIILEKYQQQPAPAKTELYFPGSVIRK